MPGENYNINPTAINMKHIPPDNSGDWVWLRTCQECFQKQKSTPPDYGNHKLAYDRKKCRKCGSESLDYGTWHNTNPNYKDPDDE